MKELSVEQKAKAYDEALKVLHKYDGANIMFSQSLKEEMFPELKESEDEKFLNDIIKNLVHPWNEYIPDRIEDEIKWLKNRLKSLRPQSQWKPSNEQMHYLYWIANVKLGDSVVEQEVSKHLNELYQDLKKLSGE